MSEKLGRYLLFAGSTYYPGGGWNDFIASSNDPSEIQPKRLDWGWEFEDNEYDWYQLIDTEKSAGDL